ncbi:MAG: hypothetical protein Q4Q04_04060 [Methanocorpusculum sp.]|nr:hypothetical protein [Methanocorpusculum sp.]
MPKKRQLTTFRRRKSNIGFFIFIFVAFLGILMLGGIAAVIVMDKEINAIDDAAYVSVIMSVTGNDVTVSIVNEGRADELIGIQIAISGAQISEKDSRARVTKGESIVFKDAGYGITGDRYVLVKGFFTDGTSEIILSSSVNFS